MIATSASTSANISSPASAKKRFDSSFTSVTSRTSSSTSIGFVDDYHVAAAVVETPPAPPETLYERIGGEEAINKLTHEFFVEIAQEKDLAHFFVNVPVEAIQFHQGKFFKVLFGPEDEKPTEDELLDYMIHTHVRLFRDMGLDEQHFDIVAGAFVRAMNTCQIPANLKDECLAIVGPLRLAFEYGAIVAKGEKRNHDKNDNTHQLEYATMETMRQKQANVVLPPGLPPPASWLVEYMDGQRQHVRAWTCALTRRFTIQDEQLSHTFTALAYLDMEPYLHSFLELAFLSEDKAVSAQDAHKLLRTVRFPLGISKAKSQLTKPLWVKMVEQFQQVGKEFVDLQEQFAYLTADSIQAAVGRLQKLTSTFIDPTRAIDGSIDGWETSHRLRHERSLENKDDSTSSSDEDWTTSSAVTESTTVSSSTTRSSKSNKKQQTNSAQRKVRFAEEKRSGTKNSIWGWLRGRKDKKNQNGHAVAA
mmetsp:Transcript_3317/g.9274  ORF Transcript_3317/g.9274 Transcript_3317/m.9274 type:complete len:476 (+) Transcript_3317:1-1428(+)